MGFSKAREKRCLASCLVENEITVLHTLVVNTVSYNQVQSKFAIFDDWQLKKSKWLI